MLKIAFTGPESSGKTTLSKRIAEILDGEWHEEYAREYLTNLKRTYNQDDLLNIALKQNEKRINCNSSLQVYDTEMLVIKIWNDYKFRKENQHINELLDQQKVDYYFLCSPDIPYEEDVLRENPDNRNELFETYLNILNQKKLPYSILEGSISKRTKQILQTLKTL